MYYSLNSPKKGGLGEIVQIIIGVIKRVTRSLNYSSYRDLWECTLG